MNTLTLLGYVIAGTGSLIGLLIHLLVILVIFALVWWVLTQIPLPPPVANIVRIIFVVIAVIFLIAFLLGISGCVTNPITGKKELDPSVRNALIDVAKSAVAGIATSEATTGKVDWNLVAQGALSQVYATSTVTAANRAIDIMVPDDKLSGAVQTALGSVVATAKEKGNLSTSDAVVIGATFLDNELSNLKAP